MNQLSDCRNARELAAGFVRAMLLVIAPTCVFGVPAATAGDQVARTLLVVDENQVVTIRETDRSLHEIVIELCRKASVNLLGFAATDRPVAIKQEGVAMDKLLARLLREESYMVGLKRDGKDGVRIAWLRVMGPEASVSGNRFDDASENTAYFGLREDVVSRALTSEDEKSRTHAVNAVLAQVRDNPDTLDAFIARGAPTLLEELGDQPYSVELLKSLGAVAETNAQRFQLMGLMRSIENYRSRDERDFKPLAILKKLEEAGVGRPPEQ